MSIIIRLFFLFVIICLSFGISVIGSSYLKLIQTIKTSESTVGTIENIQEIKFRDSRYLVNLQNQETPQIVNSIEYNFPYAVGEKVNVFTLDGTLTILDLKNLYPTIYIILLLVFLLLLSLLIVIDPPIHGKESMTEAQTKTFLLMFLFVIGIGYHTLKYSEIKSSIYYKNLVQTTGSIVGFNAGECEYQDMDGNNYSAPCYSRLLRYTVSGKIYTPEEHEKKHKNGEIGSEIDIYYLKDNPAVYQTKAETVKNNKYRWAYGVLAFLFVFILFSLNTNARGSFYYGGKPKYE